MLSLKVPQLGECRQGPWIAHEQQTLDPSASLEQVLPSRPHSCSFLPAATP